MDFSEDVAPCHDDPGSNPWDAQDLNFQQVSGPWTRTVFRTFEGWGKKSSICSRPQIDKQESKHTNPQINKFLKNTQIKKMPDIDGL